MPNNLLNQQQNNMQSTEDERVVLGTKDIPCDFMIEEATVSILDANGDEPVLNQVTLELTESVYDFITKHIEKCLKDTKIKFGKFNPQISGVREYATKLLRNEVNLIESSHVFSNILFSLMKNNMGIESCDLLTAKVNTSIGQIVAILKLDYTDNFVHNVEFVEDKLTIDITSVRTGLPTSIKKAAFIKANDLNGFDLLYLDKFKKGKNDADYAVGYWQNNFLNCEEIVNSVSTTINFAKATEDWIRAVDLDSAKQSEELRFIVRENMLENDEVSITELADEMFGDDTEKAESYKEYMSSLNFEDTVIVDKPAAIKKFNKVKIAVDKDIVLTIDRESYNNSSKFEVVENHDGSINMIIKNITSYVEK